MRLSLFAAVGLIFSQSVAYAQDEDFRLTQSPDHEYNAQGQWIHLYRRYGDDCEKYHTVKSGETCHTLAHRYHIRVDDFYSWNTQVNDNCTNLKPTKKYCVKKNNDSASKVGAANECIKKHTVKKGETCTKLASAYGISVGQLYDLNPIIHRGKCDNLMPGYSYCVKSGGKSVDNVVSKASLDNKKHSDNKKAAEDKKTAEDKKAAEEKAEQDKKAAEEKAEQDKKAAEEKAEQDKKAAEEKAEQDKKAAEEKAGQEKKENDTKDQDDDDKVDSKISNLKQRHLLKKNAAFTYYWRAHSDDYSKSGKKVSIKTCGGKTIATIPQAFADACVMEGSCSISKSKVVNLGSCSCSKDYACFMELDAETEAYGLTSYGTSLRPFITVAANDIRRNTKIYVPELDGFDLPTGKKHNGCLMVDDKSWSFEGNHIDWFVDYMDHYKTLNKKYRVSKVNVYEGGNCKLLDY